MPVWLCILGASFGLLMGSSKTATVDSLSPALKDQAAKNRISPIQTDPILDYYPRDSLINDDGWHHEYTITIDEEEWPEIVPGNTVWISEKGKKYHLSADCSNMKYAQEVSLQAAKNEGRDPCEICFKRKKWR